MNAVNTNTAQQLSAGVIISVMQDVLKRWYIILASALIAAMLAFMVADFTYTPQYRTTTTFVVTTASTTTTSYTNISTANSTATVFTEVLNSSILRQKVLQEMGISHFDGTISAAVADDTNLLTMTVTGTDPRDVFLMSKGVIEHHHTVSEKALNGTVIEVLSGPKAPVAPINSSNAKRAAMHGAVLLAMAAAAVIALVSYMQDKIRSKTEADAKLSCHVLGEIYHERKNKTFRAGLSRKKKSILITDPVTSFVYTEAVNKLAGRVDKRRHKGEHVIMVTSVLENEGKSTVAANLALSFAKKGKKVLLMDCDLRKPSCGLIFDITDVPAGTSDVLQGKCSLANGVRYLENQGIYLLASRKSFKAAANLTNSPAMEKLLREAAANFDLVIVDVPPMATAPDAESICSQTDASLLVVRQNAAITDAVNEAAAVLDKNSHLLGCVLNNMFGAGNFAPVHRYSTYGKYGKYGKYGRYGKYGYGNYGHHTAGEEDA